MILMTISVILSNFRISTMEPHLNIEILERTYHSDPNAFQDMVEKFDIGIGVYNRTAAPIACNKSAYELLGMTKDQFMGNSAMDPYWEITHEDGSKFEQYDFPIIETITNYKEKLGVIMGVSRPQKGDKVWLEVNTHPILRNDGSVRRIFCTYKQIEDPKS